MADDQQATPATADTAAAAPSDATQATATTASATASDQKATDQAQTWFGSFDDETRGWLQNRGLDKLTQDGALPELVKGYRNLEKHLGVPADRLVRLPENTADDKEMAAVYDKLGRPSKPDDYKVEVPEGVPNSEEFVGWAKKTFHELGLSAKQGEALAAKWNEYIASESQQVLEQTQQTVEAATATLKKEWGQAYDQNRAIGARARQVLKLSDEDVDGISTVLGVDRTVKLMYEIGSKVLEAPVLEGGIGMSQRILSPEQAKAEIATLKADDGFRKKLMAGDADAQARWNKLHQQAFSA